ncbi:hypothetical protein CRENBAI_024595 [Crenichthys baileyi]|uniref:Uncharacterized protein n=1 Tax=Crenichthys baileyi TaxID=28760 RepID=A0AAV9SN40_9TELE
MEAKTSNHFLHRLRAPTNPQQQDCPAPSREETPQDPKHPGQAPGHCSSLNLKGPRKREHITILPGEQVPGRSRGKDDHQSPE